MGTVQLCPHIRMVMKVIFALFSVLRPGLACFPTTPPQPPAPCSNLTQSCSAMDCCGGLLCAPLVSVCVPDLSPPCKNLGEECGLLAGACCDGLDCAPIISKCFPALGRKKRSASAEYDPCEYLVKIEQTAFDECQSDGEEGLTWTEVKQCEAKYADYGVPVPLPTFEDFQEYDLDKDGTLLMEEWRNKSNC